jgi:antitoxin component of MazEF toxin-antitoxin module
MIARESRLVGEMGEAPSTSLLVRMPKTYTRSVGISKGSKVTVVFGLGNVLIIAPAGREREIDRLIAATRGRL